MKCLYILCFLFLSHISGLGQSKLGNEWITGAGGQRIKFTQNGIQTNDNNFILSYFRRGNSNICDSNGHLILASDGYNIYDILGNIIDGGDTLVYNELFNHYNGYSPFSQSSIFLPIDSNKYYFITPTYRNGNQCFSCHFDEILYNIIDMNANGGAGKVTKRMKPLVTNGNFSRTQMMACRHANGKDWWLLKQGGDSNIVYKFLFTQDSVYNKGHQVFNDPYWGTWDIIGQTTISQDGKKYASACQGDGLQGEIFLADFDRCIGELHNPRVIEMPLWSQNDPNLPNATERSPVGVSFSASGNMLYVMGFSNIFQYDLMDSTWTHITGLDTSHLYFQDYSSSYLGPDNKLYIGNRNGLSKQMSVINNPDLKGSACDFCPRCLRLDSLGSQAYVGTPPCMPNYSLGAESCWPLNMDNVISNNRQLIVYPNPTHSILYIKTEQKHIKELCNSVGQLILKTNENEIDASALTQGVYFLRCGSEVKKVIIE